MRYKYVIATALICLLFFMDAAFFAREIFSEEENPPPPKEIMEEILSNETVPEDVRRELERMLREMPPEGTEEPPPIIPPAEEEYPPSIDEGGPEIMEEPEELQRLEIPETVPPARMDKETMPEVVSSAKSDKISLDLKGVDIIDVLKMLSARSNLNIVAGRNVRGKVTLFLKDVNVWDAFEIILAANDLAYEKEGDIINVMTERDYELLYGDRYYNKKDLRIYHLEYAKAAEVSKALTQVKSKIGKVIVDEGSNTVVLIDSPQALADMEKMIGKMDMPIETKVFSLDYAKAEDVKTKISEILTKGVGTIQVDERTNKVVITDLSKKMPEISNIIEEVDERHKEVLIEAKIVQIELNDQYKYGVDWKALFRKSPDEGLRAYFDNISGSVFGGAATGSALTIAQVAHEYLDATIEALQTVGKTNVISSPRITVLNNEEAKVLVGTNQPYVTTTTTVPEGGQSITSESVTYIDVGVQLTVTPTINKDGYVTMKIKPKVSSLGTPLTTAEENQIPVVSTSETETTVMVKDGHTILIAGLIQDRDEMQENKVPILGDIPLVGNLFKNKSTGSTSVPEKKELVVFLTPYIVHGTEVFLEVENVHYRKSLAQKELLEKQISMAVEDLQRKRSLVMAEIPPKEEEEDSATRFAKDVTWFKKPEKEKKEEAKEGKEKETKPEAEVVQEEPKKEGAMPPSYLTLAPITGYYSYYENLRNKIYWVAKDNFPRKLRKGEKEDVEVFFTLTNDGKLKGEPRVLNQVDESLAEAAKNSVRKAMPFPPFPKKMEKEEESFRITITYQ